MLACSCDRVLESGKWGREGETGKLQDTWIPVPEGSVPFCLDDAARLCYSRTGTGTGLSE